MPELASNAKLTDDEYLTRLRTLSREITSAISAIERNDLQALQASIAVQEVYCEALNQASRPLPNLRGETAQRVEWSASPVVQQIRAEATGLAHLNRAYAAVLKRAQMSANLLFGLYRNYGQGYGKDTPAVTERHTWSCEV